MTASEEFWKSVTLTVPGYILRAVENVLCTVKSDQCTSPVMFTKSTMYNCWSRQWKSVTMAAKHIEYLNMGFQGDAGSVV